MSITPGSPSPQPPFGRPSRRLWGRLFRWPWGPVRPIDPSPATEDDQQSAACTRAQVAVIRKAFGERIRAADPDGRRPAKDDAEIGFLYRTNHLLVRTDIARDVVEHLNRRGSFRGEVEIVEDEVPVRDRLVVIKVPERTDERDAVLGTLEELDQVFGSGVITPDHVVFVTKEIGKFCPADEPLRPKKPEPWPAQQSSSGSTDKPVRISVVDTGLWMPAVGNKVTPWLEPGAVVADPTDEEQVDPHHIHPYAGHGTFVSGVIRCMAPDTTIEVEGALTHGGAVLESAIVAQLDEALHDDLDPQIISISAGTYTRNDFALLGFEMLADAHGLGEGSTTLVVAAAGNDSTTRPFWPAAFPWVVAVGALDSDGTMASYSNHGRWVDVFARGTDIVNAFPHGTYHCYEPQNSGQVRTFEGLAQWSGTSFSTPIVTGLIAAEMSASGTDAPTAWAAVKAAGTVSGQAGTGSAPTVGPLT